MQTQIAAYTAPLETVAVVDGNPQVLAILDAALAAERYNVLLLDSREHAYRDVKRLHPNVVVLCMRLDAADSCQLLSMLKLDAETRDIPIITLPAEDEPEQR